MVDLPRLLELKQKYKFRVLLDETWSYGVVGRSGRGVTEFYGIPAMQVDAIVGSLAGCISSGGGFCTGAKDMVEHQRLNAAAFTYSASLCAFLAETASRVIVRLQSNEGSRMVQVLHENVEALRSQLQRSEWVYCTSAPENPVLHLVIKEQVIRGRHLSRETQEFLLQDCVDECLSNHNILITRLKAMPPMEGLPARHVDAEWQPQPALKVCATIGLSKREIEKSGTAIRHAVTSLMKRGKWQRG